jgi:predicted nucleic acid-binding protein
MTIPSSFVADASVVIKWLHRTDERLTDEAGRLLQAHLDGTAVAHILDLTIFEVGSALVRRRELNSEAVESMIAPLWRVGLVWLFLDERATQAAVGFARRHALSFYDASYLAVAQQEKAALVTDDKALLTAAYAEDLGVALADVT